MQLHTPLPYSFANNKGTKSRLKLHDIDAPIHSASCNKPDLPRNTVLVNKRQNAIEYRIQYDRYDYASIEVWSNNIPYNKGRTFHTGASPNIDLYMNFMATIKSLHPMVMQLFSS